MYYNVLSHIWTLPWLAIRMKSERTESGKDSGAMPKYTYQNLRITDMALQYQNSNKLGLWGVVMNLKEFRLAKGLTQKAIADYIGCSPVVYSRYETGHREPSIDILIKIADFFEVALDDIIGRAKPNASRLTAYEKALLTAARKADERAKQDALNMLAAHSVENQRKN
jgi:transcriptional regulator with XRE-family HTH domain